MYVELLAFFKESFRQILFHQSEAFDRIFVRKAFSTSELIKSVIWTISVNVVFDQDGLAFVSLNHGGGHVAIGKIIHAHDFLGNFLAFVGWRTHRNQGLHAVAAVDVEGLAEGSEAMGGIDISLVSLVEVKPPVVPVLVPERVQAVEVRTFDMEDLSKEASLCHRQA